MKTALSFLAAPLCAAALALTAQAEPRVGIDLGLRIGIPAPIVVREAPPRPVVERVVVSPGPGYVLVAGHHTWRDNRWVWVSGTWVQPPQPNATYVEGRWDERNRNWVESHWEVSSRESEREHYDDSRRGDREQGDRSRRMESGPGYFTDAPPPPRHENMSARPSRRHVWIEGYWIGRDHRQEWVSGHWELPPRDHARWDAPRWEHRGSSYVFVAGTWR
jgi:hypothetical protein